MRTTWGVVRRGDVWRWRAALFLLPLAFHFLAPRSVKAQVAPIPSGLVTSQAASVVVGQTSFSDITSGSDDRRWGAISGIAITGNTLIVVDSSYLAPPNNNRVLIYNSPGYNDLPALRQRLPQDELPNASVILGQPGPGETDPGTSATRMFQPSGVATDGTRLFIAEWGNNRVLIYHRIPTEDGAAADVVIGQDTFTTSGFGTSAKALRRPNGVATDGTRLFIADSLNNRVLIYNSIPTQNGASADVVIGQSNFTTFQRQPPSASTMFDPMSATTDGQRLIVTDLGNNRVLIYNSIPAQNGAPADVVVGQPDFTSSAPGNTATSLNFPRYAFSDGTRLVIVDSGNNRILIYNQIPTTNGAAADIVLGQEDFVGLLESCAASNLAVPFAAVSDGEMLYVSDAFNRRVLGFRPGQPLVELVTNGASFSTLPQTAACEVILLQPPVAPGGIASIFGTNLANATELADSLPLPKELAGTKVFVNGIQAPLYFVSPTRINLQVPFEVKGFSASMELERETGSGVFRSTAVPLGLANGAPGIFTWNGTGSGPGVITHTDFSPVTESNPARPGEMLVAFVTGLGSVDKPMTSGAAAEFAAEGEVSVAGVTTTAGQTVTIFLNGVPYSYTTLEGDLVADVVTRLAQIIADHDPVITATADTENSLVLLRTRQLGDQGVSNVYSVAVSEGASIFAATGGTNIVPGGIEFSGTPQPGQAIVVKLLDTGFEYITEPGDTLDSVLVKLADIVGSDPNVSAQADLVNHTIQLALKDPEAELTITFSISISPPGATIIATALGTSVVPGNVLIGGVPGPGQIVSVFLQGTRYAYTTTASDTLETIVSGLTSLINEDPNVSATADLPNRTIQLALKTPNLAISFSTLVTLADALQLDTARAGKIPATVTVLGVPRAEQIATVFLAGSRYAYKVQSGDTAATVAARLAALLNQDPNVSATFENNTIELSLRDPEGGLEIALATVVTPPPGLEAITSGQHFTPGVGTVTNTVSAFLGETLPAVPGDILFFDAPVAGEIVTVRLAETPYSYTVAEGDTLATLVSKLAELVNSDPNVAATADTAASRIALALKDPNFETKIGFSVTIDPSLGGLRALSRSTTTTDALPATIAFAGPIKGTAGLYEVRFTVPSDAPDNPATKLTLVQNLIIFGSVSNFDIFSNRVTFPVAKETSQ